MIDRARCCASRYVLFNRNMYVSGQSVDPFALPDSGANVDLSAGRRCAICGRLRTGKGSLHLAAIAPTGRWRQELAYRAMRGSWPKSLTAPFRKMPASCGFSGLGAVSAGHCRDTPSYKLATFLGPPGNGFRPGRSAHQAVAQAQQHIVARYGWVVLRPKKER